MHGGVSAPSFCAFPHRVAFKEVSGHRVHFKSGPGNRGHSACGTTHVAHLEISRETTIILRCAGKAGNPFHTSRGIDSLVAIRRGDGAQMKWCRDPLCSTRGNPAFQGTLGGRIKGAKYRFPLQDGTWDFPKQTNARCHAPKEMEIIPASYETCRHPAFTMVLSVGSHGLWGQRRQSNAGRSQRAGAGDSETSGDLSAFVWSLTGHTPCRAGCRF